MNTCQNCQSPIPDVGRNGLPRKWCSRACYVAHHFATNPAAREKQAAAAAERHRRRYVPTAHRLVCKICAEPFEAKRSDTLYCSPTCKQKAAWLAQVASGYRAAYQAANRDKDRERIRAYRRRVPAHERRSAAIVDAEKRREERKRLDAELVPRAEIFERDLWTCQLCEKSIDRDLSWPDPLSASLDHVVPLAKGGKHTRGNLQAAHLRCNLQKGDRVA